MLFYLRTALLAGGADRTAGLGRTFEYPETCKAQVRSKWYGGFSHTWCIKTHSSWTQHQGGHAATGGKKKNSLGRNNLHLEREFCKLWQCCHSFACELAERCKQLGNARKGAQGLHSNKNCHHYKGIKIINSTRPNIKPKGIPKLASPEEQTLFPKPFFFLVGWGGGWWVCISYLLHLFLY